MAERARPIWSSWRSSCWRSAVGSFSFAELAPGRAAAGPGLCRGAGSLAAPACRRLDAQMLAIDMAELDGMSPRERVFELIMRRLDAMVPYKSLRTLARKAGREPMPRRGCCNLDRLQSAPARRGRHRREARS